jgi:4-hydroxy-3-polyprenylbenzoate decarboxylase
MARGASEEEVWQALYGAASFQPAWGKIVVAVDEDIDPQNADALLWAMAYRMKPHRDVQVLKAKNPGHGPRPRRTDWGRDQDSALLINATLREQYPPISLPKREYMERAKELWERLGLPPLEPESPWYGYSLGDWNEELEEEARLAVAGDYWQTGEKIARQRRRTSEIPPNTSFYGTPADDRS